MVSKALIDEYGRRVLMGSKPVRYRGSYVLMMERACKNFAQKALLLAAERTDFLFT